MRKQKLTQKTRAIFRSCHFGCIVYTKVKQPHVKHHASILLGIIGEIKRLLYPQITDINFNLSK